MVIYIVDINRYVMKTAARVPQIAYYTKPSIKYGSTYKAFKRTVYFLFSFSHLKDVHLQL